MLPVFPLLFEAVVVFGVAVRFAVVTGADTYSIIMLKIAWKINKNVGLTVIRNEITYQLLADGFRVHTKLPSDS